MRGPCLAFAGLVAAAVLASAYGRFCERPPVWTASGVQPMINTRGKVTVVALLLATWPMCQQQATGLEAIRKEYNNHGRTEITFMIVNSKDAADQISLLSSRVNFPVYQDTNQSNIWTKLNGGKDDMYIYDRCGKLVYFIPFPSSLLRYHLTDWAIRSAYNFNSCRCQRRTRSRLRRRRHNHERHRSRHNQGIVVGMGNSGLRNRAPTWRGTSWNNSRRSHRIIRKLWSLMKKHYSHQTNRRAWMCPTVSSNLERSCSCRQAFFPERIGVCSCDELTLTVVQECVWYNCNSFLRRNSLLNEVLRPNWDFLTTWPCDLNSDLSATCRWSVSTDTTWQWRTDVSGSQTCSWPSPTDSWSWRTIGEFTSWQWPNQQICNWQQDLNIWQCTTNDTSSPWQWQPNESGGKSWQWHHISGNCMWQCISTNNGHLSWEWPIGETDSAVIRWQSTQLDERWQWHASVDHNKSCQCTSPLGNSATWRCGKRWHCHNDGTSLNWHCSGQNHQADVWSWPISRSGNHRLWQCRTIDNDWHWQGLTASGQTWEESRQDGQLWPWQNRWQWQVSAWQWRREGQGYGVWLWHHASQSWRWQNILT